jgi:hypothetical protein
MIPHTARKDHGIAVITARQNQSAGERELLFVLQKDHTRRSLLHKGVTGRKFLSAHMAAIDHRRPVT